jgi:uncharacterized protein YbcI
MTEAPGLSTAGEISRRSVQLLREYTGRGPTQARTVINHDSVLILLHDTLTKGERKLAENGKADHVLHGRHQFQLVMRDDLVHVVEQETGRKVVAFMSDNHLDPDVAAEVFVLEPVANGDPRDGYEG